LKRAGISSTACASRLPVSFQRRQLPREHDFVYVVEQNRDAQLRSLIVNENGIDPVRLVPILHYDAPDHRAFHRRRHRRPPGPAQGHSSP